MDTQTSVLDIDMPSSKRARTSSSKAAKRYSTKGRKSQIKNVRKTWPYAQSGLGPLWDPFPAKARALLRYSTVISLNPLAGTVGNHLFRANGIQDPDFTGIGHQPYGHDTYETIYNHYNVRRATIVMTPTNSRNGIFGISLCDDSVVQTNYDTVRETKGTKYACVTSNSRGPSVQQVFDVNQNFDIPFQKSTSASFGQNPSEGMIFHCWFEGNNSSATPGEMTFTVNISYEVEMWELKDLGLS